MTAPTKPADDAKTEAWIEYAKAMQSEADGLRDEVESLEGRNSELRDEAIELQEKLSGEDVLDEIRDALRAQSSDEILGVESDLGDKIRAVLQRYQSGPVLL